MNELSYQMIFKRKSFHIFRDIGKIELTDLEEIKERIGKLKPLDCDIKTKIRVVPGKETSCKRGQEYCILFYSEKKDNYLQNIGYMGEQLDLYLSSINVGALWFGIGKPDESQYDGLDFVIMIAIAKMPEGKFRKDMFKAKRKELSEIWDGNMTDYANIVRFAPSACNTQPWIAENLDSCLKIYRYKKPGKRGIMPKDKVIYYNRIDIGIFMCFIETCLAHEGIEYKRKLYKDNADDSELKVLTAEYKLLSDSGTHFCHGSTNAAEYVAEVLGNGDKG